MSTTIESLELELLSSSKSAESSLEALSASLEKLKKATNGGAGLSSIVKRIKTLGDAAKSVDSSSVSNLNGLTNAIQTLSNLGGVKLSSTIATQITAIGESAKMLNGVNFTSISNLAASLQPLNAIGKVNLSSVMSQLKQVPEVATQLNSSDMSGFSAKIKELAASLRPLSEMPKQTISSTLTQIKKIPEIIAGLNSVDIGAFSAKIQELATSLKPLADEMNKVAAGFSAFPAKIQKLIENTNSLALSNSRVTGTYVNLYAKIKMAFTSLKGIVRTIGAAITTTNEYIENVNLFTASMGQYANVAQDYAEKVGELMGIDPGEWMRNQGVFMTLATGFGVAEDRAYTMSEQLTQLGYDLSSFYNIGYEEAMQKLQSGISGEREPLRRLGYDLSQAKLQAVALSLGIDKSVSSMTQAEKAQLRYYAIMTQVVTVQGDMGRTLDAPANQLRILKAQVTQAARAIGSIFIPVLISVLPIAIAITKVIANLARSVASLVGFKMPEVDYSGIDTVTGSAKDASEALDDATESAKELKATVLGIDELNLLVDNNSNNNSSDIEDVLGQFDFKLPTYDFIGSATENRIAKITEEINKWLGLTGEINSWADLFNTKLGEILKIVGEIGIGIMAWKATKFILNLSQNIKMLLADAAKLKIIKVEAGVTLSVTGITLSIDAGADIASNGLTINNFLKAIGGIAATAVGGKLIGSAIGAAAGGPIGLAIGLGVGLIATLISVAVNSESDSKKLIDAFYKSEEGKKLSKLKEDVAAACNMTTSLVVQVKDIKTEVDKDILANYSLGRDLLNRIFSLDAKDIKTDADIAYLHTLVDIFNSLNLTDVSGNSLVIQFDKLGKNIATSREELEKLIDTTLQSYKLEAIKEASIKTYKTIIELNETKEDLYARTREPVDTRDAAETTIARLKSRLAKMIVDSGVDGIDREWANRFLKRIDGAELIKADGEHLSKLKWSLEKSIGFDLNKPNALNEMMQLLDDMVAPYKTAIESQNLVDELFASIEETNKGLDEAYAKLDKYEKDLTTGMISLSEAASSSEQAIDSFSSKTIDNMEGITTQITDSTSGVSDKITSCATDASNKITGVSAEIVSKLTDDAEMVVNGAEVQTTGFVKAISAIFNTITNDFRVWSTGTISELQVFLNNAENRVNNFIKNISEKSVTLTLSSKASYEFSGYQAYANGGFPEDGLFFANQSELVGEFSNGKTAVANNEQIISGIKQGVKEAMQETQNSEGDIIIQIVDSAGNVKSQEYVKSSQLTNRRSGKVVIPIGV